MFFFTSVFITTNVASNNAIQLPGAETNCNCYVEGQVVTTTAVDFVVTEGFEQGSRR